MEPSLTTLIQSLKEKGIKNKAVLHAIEQTPRELFVPSHLTALAYEDIPLLIGCNQTISQPYIVARMTELLIEKKPKKVLEIGTGSGYQTAILAQLVSEIYSVERINTLLIKAKKRLAKLNLPTTPSFICADGSQGWAEHAPFDAIIVAAAASSLPEKLLSQLAEGGRLVIPIGEFGTQFLYVIDKTKDTYESQRLDAVRFVPLVEGKTAL